jgi:hypothetical protein
MSVIDPKDDSIARWVVHHYRWDPERNERRNVVVSAFDNKQEFNFEVARLAAELRLAQATGTRSADEQISGVALPVGYLAEAARGHAIKTAIEHGATKAVIEIQSAGTTGSVGVLRSTKST